MREFLNPDVEASQKATRIAQGKKPKTKTPPPDETTIVVLNGNGVDGSADTAAYLLSQRGYQAQPGGNADPENDGVPNFDYFQTQIVYDPAKAGAAEAAQTVAQPLRGRGGRRGFRRDEGRHDAQGDRRSDLPRHDRRRTGGPHARSISLRRS